MSIVVASLPVAEDSVSSSDTIFTHLRLFRERRVDN